MIAYAITDPSTLNFQTLTTDIQCFSTKADMLVYRDKSTHNYAKNAKRFIAESKKHNFQKILLHTDYILAHELKADGVHLKSTQFSDIANAKALGLFVVISTHTQEEAQKAEALGADMLTFSSIFVSPNKGEPKGVEELKKLISMLSIPVIALGGILTEEQIVLCQKSGAFGFASIRYFSLGSATINTSL
ncbi:MAG: Thiamine monophosphate synthase [uncultured Sulfurovum sp.]|uniref:Thiamine monophosphate synthase n=1 Tax=uncultured Sulfurovum sp. TaxID=269237 RepID=A0A6S6U5B8_9BACT|nr:MAG: Thiamine monophosphate synthase [uncultured Sulfurovum sp.]